MLSLGCGGARPKPAELAAVTAACGATVAGVQVAETQGAGSVYAPLGALTVCVAAGAWALSLPEEDCHDDP